MAEEVEGEIEKALNLVVSTTEQSSNMRKALKEKISETVSTLRQLFVKIKISGDRKLSEINSLTKKVSKLDTELQNCREKQAEVQQMPSIATLLNTAVREKGYTAQHLLD
jgi:chromosome segregation ATPase